jgi:hypothetical protein
MADATVGEQASHSQSLLEVPDRRRPGRPRSVSPSLVPLLRKPLPDPAVAEALLAVDRLFEADICEPDRSEDLGAARGILVGLVLSLPLWGLIALVVSAVF